MSTSAKETSSGKRPRATKERAAERKKKRIQHDPEHHLSFLQRSRGLLDALIFAFILAMFIRGFVFELFKIPTGSMTPTLIGDTARDVAFYDYDEDGIEDVVYTFSRNSIDTLQIYLMNEDGSYKDQIFLTDVPLNVVRALKSEGSGREDMIIVNKFAYWFSAPDRGDIAVFKVPHRPPRFAFNTEKPVYIKRVVGLPGEEVAFLPVDTKELRRGHPDRYGSTFGGKEIHLDAQNVLADGDPLDSGPFEFIMHYPRPRMRNHIPSGNDPVNTITVDEDSVLMIGDNSASSQDGRYWGGVPQSHLRGKAILRYWPIGEFHFLQ